MFSATRCGVMVSKAGPWDLSSAKYAGKTVDVSARGSSVVAVAFSADGTKMYIKNITMSSVYQYTLSTAWDVSTATYASKAFNISQDTNVRDLAFSTDGTKMYLLGGNNYRIYQYALSTAWDISTASYTNYVSISAQESANSVAGLNISADGTKLVFMGSTGGERLYRYTLSTPWSITTATYVNNSPLIDTLDAAVRGVSISSDGLRCYLSGSSTDSFYQYSMSTAWDVSTLSYTGKIKSITTLLGTASVAPWGIAISPLGNAIYLADTNVDSIHQFSMG